MLKGNAVARKVGTTMVTGALVLSLAPAAALADDTTADTQGQAESADAAPDGESDGDASEPPDGVGGGELASSEGTEGGTAPDGETMGNEATMGEGGDAMGGDAMGDGGTGGGSADTMTFDYTGTYTGAIEADGEEVSADGETYEATATDQNAALVHNGGVINLANVTLIKSGDDNDGDNCNFYGVNSILLAVGETSVAIVADSTLSATSEGSNGIFATDSATVYASNVTITTTQDNSRGLDATYAGTIIASNVTISTEGDHCAGVATDRGGGYISLNGGTIETAGSGSPVLYSTGDVEVNDVTGTATGSQIVGMEGTNTILINNSTLTSTITEKTASDPVADAVIIYQSTSGDAEASTGDTATFQVANSTLSSSIESGSFFYFTNTSADMVLYNSVIEYDSDAANLILVAGNDSNNWGSAGSNGATVKVTAIEQELEGTIEADTISSVDVYLTDGSVWTGITVISENDTASTVDEPVSVSIDATSTWVVTADCELSNLTVAEGGQVVDAEGATVTIVADGETVVEGTSSITVTVNGTYSTDYDESEEGTLATSLIDRSGYDEYFGTDTAWTMGSLATASDDAGDTDDVDDADDNAEEAEAEEGEATGFFAQLIAWLKSLFS